MQIPRKRFGQHFLKDEFIIHQIINAIGPKPGEHIIEIGCGQGALTFPLLDKHPNLIGIEFDRDLAAYLKSRTLNTHFKLYADNVLTFDFASLPKPIRIVGNLPYNISTQILFYLLNFKPIIKDMIFMLQKEVVERLCADINTKNYGRLTIMLQHEFDMEHLFDVPPESFNPAPKVNSAMIRFIPHQKYLLTPKIWFDKIIRQAFQHRRKTLRNALKAYLTSDNMINCDINFSSRAENLSIENYIYLAKFLEKLNP